MGNLPTVRMVERRRRRGKKRDFIIVNATDESNPLYADKYKRAGGIREPEQARYSVTTSDGRARG